MAKDWADSLLEGIIAGSDIGFKRNSLQQARAEREMENFIKLNELQQKQVGTQIDMGKNFGMVPTVVPPNQIPPRLNPMQVGNQTYINNQNMLNRMKSLKPNYGNELIDTGAVNPDGTPIVLPKAQANFNRLNDIQKQTRWQAFINKNDPTLASSRSTLGMVSLANLRANRALEILDNPVTTKQDLQAIVSDFSGIMQNGVPTDSVMKHSDYMTLYGKMKNTLQFLSGNPQEAIPPKIKEHIRENLIALREVDNSYLKQHLDSTAKTFSHLKKEFPEGWQGYEEGISGLMKGYGGKKSESSKSGGQLMTDAQGNRAMVFPDGSYEELK